MHVAVCRATGSSSEVGTREADMCYKTACSSSGHNTSAAQYRRWRTVGGRNVSLVC